MTSQSPVTTPSGYPVPTLLSNLVRAYGQKALTAVWVLLAAHGVQASTAQQADVTSFVMAALALGLSLAWTHLQEISSVRTLEDALNAPAANPPVKLT